MAEEIETPRGEKEENREETEAPTVETVERPIRQNLLARDTWMRGLFMLLFVVIFGIAEFVVYAVVIFQFGAMLLVRKPNRRLLEFGQSLSTFVYEVLLFLTYASEEKPFPFASWPKGPLGGAPAPAEGETA